MGFLWIIPRVDVSYGLVQMTEMKMAVVPWRYVPVGIFSCGPVEVILWTGPNDRKEIWPSEGITVDWFP